jgi:hypothetical protein
MQLYKAKLPLKIKVFIWYGVHNAIFTISEEKMEG